MIYQCIHCAVRSDVAEHFYKQRRSFRKTEYYICTACWTTRTELRHGRSLLTYSVVAVLTAIWVASHPTPGFAIFTLNLTLLYLATIPATILHEIGHAAAAYLVRWRLYRIVVGWFGKPIFKRSIAGVIWQLNSVPLGGMAYVFPRDERWFRLKAIVVYLGGPLANGLLALFSFSHWPFSTLDQRVQFLGMFSVANLICFAVSIIPSKLRYSTTSCQTDGMLVLRALFGPAQLMNDSLIAASVMEVTSFRTSDRHAEGLRILDQALVRHPDNFTLLSYRALLLMDLRLYQEARTLYLQLLQNCPKDPYYEAVIYNNIAWANVLIGDPETLPEALAYSEKAFSPYRTVSAFQGTRGAVLAASGQVAEGIALLESSFRSKTDDDKQGQALNACMLARAEKKLGNAAASAQWLQTACDLHPQCPLLPRFNPNPENG